MKLSILSLASMASLASAHFKLDYPTSRGKSEDKMPQFPCGGLSQSSERTKVSLSAGDLPVALTLGHSQTAVEVLLGLGNDPGSNFNITLHPTFRIEGLGSFCLPNVTFIESVVGVKLTEGMNATLQVQSNGDPSGGLYACADIQFTDTDYSSPSSCTNNTGIKTIEFTGDAAKHNANESTADGKAQSGSSSASSTTGSGGATSTGGAVALETAAWGMLGAAVMGGMAILTSRHHLRFYYNVAVSARYTLPPAHDKPLKHYIYKACSALIAQHPILSAVPVGEETREPFFARVPEINLDRVVRFQGVSGDGLEGVLGREHNASFEALGVCWRVVVLTEGRDQDQDKGENRDEGEGGKEAKERSFTVVFIFHHGLGDGTSGKVFHRDFLKALKTASSTAEEQERGEPHSIIPSPETPLLPSTETLHPHPISFTYLASELFKAKVWSYRDPGLWTGGKIQTPLRTNVRISPLDKHTTAELRVRSRNYKTTVTAVLQTVIARALFALLPSNYTRVICTGAMSTRRWHPDPVSDDVMGVFVQDFTVDYVRGGVGDVWAEAVRTRVEIEKVLAREGSDASPNLLRFVDEFHDSLLLSKVGRERGASFEVSNIGALAAAETVEEGVPRMGRMVFSQSASVTGNAIEVSAASGPDGCLVLAWSWQEGVVEGELVMRAMEAVKGGIGELVSNL
ncbi:hypothetical protein BDV25DRAFT_143394 [Aspergillus avenaceus]|uniref:Copper acquisition factor BIM1-like domain-containing protein n=1 Tax=Aspergillus avenaceus TaxID=36643 RepID=A0A5N6TK57_ASPAV|nr:hypothetical protein BDV25DRAFT_143394 [Aspergillus avenaceus]